MNNQPKNGICPNLGGSRDNISLSYVIFVKKNGERYRRFHYSKCCPRHMYQLVLRLFNGPTDSFFLPIACHFADFLRRYLEIENNPEWSDEPPTYIFEGESSDEDEGEMTRRSTNQTTEELIKQTTETTEKAEVTKEQKDMKSDSYKENEELKKVHLNKKEEEDNDLP